MINKLKNTLKVYKTTVFLITLLILLILTGFLVFQKFVPQKQEAFLEEVDLSFDSEGPFALLFPRRDGNALILNLKRTFSYGRISYELAYNAEGIDRGVMGEIDTKDKKGEYEQEILFGTCSKKVCKYDQGVENGTLILHIKRGKEALRMITQWHLQRPDVALGQLSSGDGHFIYKVDADRQALSNVGFSIINDLTGVQKLPQDKKIVGKVYALNTPLTRGIPEGVVEIELAEKPPLDAKIARFNESENKWIEFETKMDGSKLSGKADGSGIFAVLVSK
mgnify:CR=1 FL=1